MLLVAWTGVLEKRNNQNAIRMIGKRKRQKKDFFIAFFFFLTTVEECMQKPAFNDKRL